NERVEVVGYGEGGYLVPGPEAAGCQLLTHQAKHTAEQAPEEDDSRHRGQTSCRRWWLAKGARTADFDIVAEGIQFRPEAIGIGGRRSETGSRPRPHRARARDSGIDPDREASVAPLPTAARAGP